MGCLHGFWIGIAELKYNIFGPFFQPTLWLYRVPEKVMVTSQTELKMNQQARFSLYSYPPSVTLNSKVIVWRDSYLLFVMILVVFLVSFCGNPPIVQHCYTLIDSDLVEKP